MRLPTGRSGARLFSLQATALPLPTLSSCSYNRDVMLGTFKASQSHRVNSARMVQTKKKMLLLLLFVVGLRFFLRGINNSSSSSSPSLFSTNRILLLLLHHKILSLCQCYIIIQLATYPPIVYPSRLVNSMFSNKNLHPDTFRVSN